MLHFNMYVYTCWLRMETDEQTIFWFLEARTYESCCSFKHVLRPVKAQNFPGIKMML